MKNILLTLCVGACLCGCENFLDTENYTQKNTENFPLSADDANAMLTGIYSIQNTYNNEVKNHPYLVSEAASDERLGDVVKIVQIFNLWISCWCQILITLSQYGLTDTRVFIEQTCCLKL